MTAVRAGTGALLAAGCGLGGLVSLAFGVDPLWTVGLVLLGAVLLGGFGYWSRARLVTGVVALGVASSCWDAVRVGSTGLFDALAVLGVLVVLVDLVLRDGAAIRWPPRAWWVGAGGIGLAFLLVAVFPPDSFYLAARYLMSTGTLGAGAAGAVYDPSNLASMVRWVIGLLVLPTVLGWYARDRSALLVVGRAFAAGAALSALIAVTDFAGVTSVGEALIGYVNGGDRATGLTTQPNHLGLTAVMAMPFVLLTFRSRSVRIAGTVLLAVAAAVSGSRAALIGVALVLVVWAAWRFRARFVLAAVPVGVAVLIGLSGLLEYTRFGGDNAAGSDAERQQVLRQGLDDFVYSPLFGIGPGYSQEAHVIYVQLLASSGLIGLLSLAVLVVSALRTAIRRRDDPAAVAAGMSLVAFLATGVISNILLARYVFVPLAVLAVSARYLASTSGSISSSPPRAETDSMVQVVDTPGVHDTQV